MRIGVFFPTKEHGSFDDMLRRIAGVASAGFHSAWLPQSAGFDALNLFAVAGREVEGIELGTSVIPTYPRHPISLAAQALTTNASTGGKLVLGIGLSHKMAIEGRYGMSYDRPARHMGEYLEILLPLLRGETVDFAGETLTGRGDLTIEGAAAPPVLLAALQPRMLELAGRLADGTVTWCTGPITLREQIVPVLRAAAGAAGRGRPRVVVPLPIIVTDDPTTGRTKADQQLEGYGRIPVYRAVLDREGVESPGDVSIVGDEASVTDQLARLEEIGATDFVAIPAGDARDRSRTLEHLAAFVAGT